MIYVVYSIQTICWWLEYIFSFLSHVWTRWKTRYVSVVLLPQCVIFFSLPTWSHPSDHEILTTKETLLKPSIISKPLIPKYKQNCSCFTCSPATGQASWQEDVHSASHDTLQSTLILFQCTNRWICLRICLLSTDYKCMCAWLKLYLSQCKEISGESF